MTAQLRLRWYDSPSKRIWWLDLDVRGEGGGALGGTQLGSVELTQRKPNTYIARVRGRERGKPFVNKQRAKAWIVREVRAELAAVAGGRRAA